MSEISKTEIKSMTKVQNYIRGYKDGKTDVLDKIRAEITEDLSNAEKESKSTQDDIDCGICIGLQMAIDTIDKYKAESEDKE